MKTVVIVNFYDETLGCWHQLTYAPNDVRLNGTLMTSKRQTDSGIVVAPDTIGALDNLHCALVDEVQGVTRG